MKRPVEIDDLYRIKLVNDPAVTPDGRTVAYTVTGLDREANDYKAVIWKVNLDTGAASRMTSGSYRDGQPRWSPDGSTLAFVSNRDPDEAGKGQIWLLPAGGGEARRLTRLSEQVEQFDWSPDGRHLVCVSKVRSVPESAETDVRLIKTVRFRFDGDGFLDDKYRQLFIVDAESGDARQITSGSYEHHDPVWSPAGHEIAFASYREHGWEYLPNQDIYVIRPESGTIRRVSDGTGHWAQPSWSPDASRIACYGTRRLDSDSPRTEIFVMPAGGGAPESVTAEFDRSCSDGCIADLIGYPTRRPLWMRGGRSIAFVYSDQGAVRLARVEPESGSVTTLTGDDRRVGAIDLASDGFVFAGNDALTPGELYTCNLDWQQIRQLSHENDEWLDSVVLSQPEPFTVESQDGTSVRGWVMKPIGFEEGVRYPLLLEIHGGPFAMYGETFMHEFQLLAGRGHVVVFTNPRGSTGYGDEFAGGLYRGWGINDMPDQMAALDHVVGQGYVDEQRMGVLGGSYGGFMTNWVVTHTDRFKAACTQRTLSDLYAAFGTDDIFFAGARQTFGVMPWEEPELYWKLSPITYVENMDTPLLIIHSEQDYRCPIGQAEELFIALKRRGKTVELVRFPDESHGLSRSGKPKHRVERLQHITGWFDQHL